MILEARPVAGYGAARLYNVATSPGEMILWFSLAAAVCIAATVLPIREALRRLEKVER